MLRLLAPAHHTAATLLNNLALLYGAQGRYEAVSRIVAPRRKSRP